MGESKKVTDKRYADHDNFEKIYRVINELSKNIFDNQVYGRILSKTIKGKITQSCICMNHVHTGIENKNLLMVKRNLLELAELQKEFVDMFVKKSNFSSDDKERIEIETNLYNENLKIIEELLSLINID